MLSLSLPRRHFIGFNDLFDLIEQEPWKHVSDGFPPYNIVRCSDQEYRVELALAGWKQSEIEVETQGYELTIKGTKKDSGSSEHSQIHRGISARDFLRKFILAENVRVVSADLIDGILSIKLIHELPEALKPRRVTINADKTPGVLKG